MSLELTVPVVRGPGSVHEIGRLALEAGGGKALVVTDPGVAAAGHAGTVLASLTAAGLDARVYEGVHENPTSEDVYACAAAAKDMGADILIAVGGGSSLDTAKGCNFIYTNGGRMEEYRGLDKADRPMVPFIAVPTTGGTGSECQRFALISDPDTHEKMACGDIKALARVAVLDPLLTLTQPAFVTACTGMDAVAHAVETAVTTAATPASLHLSHESYRLLNTHYPVVLAEPDHVEARSAVQFGAAMAGSSIELSMLGAAHSAANPLTARFNVAHGQAVGLMLPHVVSRNAESSGVSDQYRALGAHAGLFEPDLDVAPAVEILAERLHDLLALAGLAGPLTAFKITDADLPGLARDAAGQWTAQFNPARFNADVFQQLYASALSLDGR
jgi:alcohol dehydrogenase